MGLLDAEQTASLPLTGHRLSLVNRLRITVPSRGTRARRCTHYAARSLATPSVRPVRATLDPGTSPPHLTLYSAAVWPGSYMYRTT